MIKEFKYKLKDPINVSKGGDYVQANDVIVYAPQPKYKVSIMKLESIIVQPLHDIMLNLNKMIDAAASSNDDAEKKDVKNNIELYEKFVIPKIDIDKMQSLETVFFDILCGGNTENPMATIGGIKFTNPLCDLLSVSDFKSLVARYCDHFLSLI